MGSHDKNMKRFPLKKKYIALGMFVFITLLLINSKPAILCQSTTTPHVLEPLSQSTTNGISSTYAKVTPDFVSRSDILCQTNLTQNGEVDPSSLPTIYAITPTYARLTQKADLTRLSQTLMLVKNIHWIVIEDSDKKTNLVSNVLDESGLNYTHLIAKTNRVDKAKSKAMASGVEQRNKALDWLQSHIKEYDVKTGVVYFMDDDNTYSLKLFEEMRKINKVGVWPVGIVGGMKIEMPIVKDGKITGYNAVWKPNRPFPIDMAGFAINVTLFQQHPEAKFSRKVQSGYQESEILKFFTTKENLEPLADNCTKVYVWHTQTHKPKIEKAAKTLNYYNIEV